jgi:hypothetical protein
MMTGKKLMLGMMVLLCCFCLLKPSYAVDTLREGGPKDLKEAIEITKAELAKEGETGLVADPAVVEIIARIKLQEQAPAEGLTPDQAVDKLRGLTQDTYTAETYLVKKFKLPPKKLEGGRGSSLMAKDFEAIGEGKDVEVPGLVAEELIEYNTAGTLQTFLAEDLPRAARGDRLNLVSVNRGIGMTLEGFDFASTGLCTLDRTVQNRVIVTTPEVALQMQDDIPRLIDEGYIISIVTDTDNEARLSGIVNGFQNSDLIRSLIDQRLIVFSMVREPDILAAVQALAKMQLADLRLDNLKPNQILAIREGV